MEKLVNKNQHFIGTCSDYTYDGLGVVKYGAFCIFVKDMIKGEMAEIVVTAVKKDYGYGKIIRLIEASPERVEPVCALSRICGGCQLQHMSAKEQAAFKYQHVLSSIRNIAKLDSPVEPILSMETGLRYRNKIMLPLGKDKNGQLVSGFYRYNSHEIIPMEDCYLQSDLANEIVKRIRELAVSYHLEQEIRHLMIRQLERTAQVMVVLVTYRQQVDNLQQLALDLAGAFEEIKSVIQNVNGAETNVVLGKEDYLLYGDQYVYDTLCDLQFKISAHSFYQVNTYQTEVLYSKAIELAELQGQEEVLDLYCGVGTIGLIASRAAKHVTGVEIVNQAVEDGRENARINHIDNVELICGDAFKVTDQLTQQGRHFDCIFIDPPRKGCSKETIDLLRKLAPEKLVYVSCNPSTLARDLALLKQDYEARTIQPVDMFPNTYHVETVVSLSRK